MTLVSVIIPVRKINNYIIKEIIPVLDNQTYKKFELIIVCQSVGKTKFPRFVKIIKTKINNPAKMRDIGASKAKGNFLAFIDDDVYPHKNWLKNILSYFENKEIAGVCGPGITPPQDNILQKVSGLVWSSWLGAGGAGVYRCLPQKKRFVDDYPTFNLIIRKNDFNKVSGFDTKFWPGEDTQLCYKIIYKLKKKIIYDPKVLVYHHRRPIFIPHLRQISRFGLHRGYFAKILPKTSLKIGYFVPSLFVFFLFITPLLINIVFMLNFKISASLIISLYLATLFFYLLLIVFEMLKIFVREKNIILCFLFIPAVITTHIVYGGYFIKGLLAKRLER